METDVNTNTVKPPQNDKAVKIPAPEVKRELTTAERLDRVERLVVRLLLGQPLESLQSRLINTEPMAMATKLALRKRYDTSKPYAGDEAKYALDSVLALCAGDIAAEQAGLDKGLADADAADQKRWRAEIEADKAAAAKKLADAEAKLAGGKVDRPEPKDNANNVIG